MRESLAQHFDTEFFDVGHTYSGHVLAVAAGIAALTVYQEEHLFERALELETLLRAGLTRLQERHPVIGDVRGLGAHFALELVHDRDSREPIVEWHDPAGSSLMGEFFAALRRRGVHSYARYNIVVVTPPLTVSDQELEQAFEALDGALGVLEEALDR
jgi:taurine--2-oxoglutarate transaminase